MIRFLLLLSLVVGTISAEKDKATATLDLIQTNFAQRSLSIISGYFDSVLGKEALPILISIVTYLVLRTTGVVGFFTLIASFMTQLNK